MDAGLGFAQLLGIAQVNQKDKTTNDVKLLKTKVSAAKKDKREKNGKPAPNVQKFLQQQEEKEKKKKIEEKLKLQKLNELRTNRDKNKIAKHLKVTKSADKSVLREAVDTRDTRHTLNGRKQCDEDDYGYESKASQGIYEKLMSKYETNPDDPMSKFAKAKPKQVKNLQEAKDRMKEALRREELGERDPEQRRRKRKEYYENNEFIDDSPSGLSKSSSSDKGRRGEYEQKYPDKVKKDEEARKKRLENAKKAPPPVDFQSLLKLANEKKDIAVKVEKKVHRKDSEFGDRPMSKREKEEYMRENEARLRREGKLPVKEKTPPVRIPKLEKREERRREEEKPRPRPEPGPQFHSAVKKSMPAPDQRRQEQERRVREERDQQREHERKIQELNRKREALKREEEEIQNKYNRESDERRRESDERIKRQKISAYNEQKRRDFERREELKYQGKYEEPSKQRPRSLHDYPGSSGSGVKRDPHSVAAREFPGERKRPQPKPSSGPYKRVIDSESEYDSEMDDFIDDTDAKFDISAEIRKITGYDKRKYKDEDFDDRSMENNKFSSIMMEEARSARIGRMEDLEDMKREEEENRMKKKKRR